MGKYFKNNAVEDGMIERIDRKTAEKKVDAELAAEFRKVGTEDIPHKERLRIMADLEMRHVARNKADAMERGDRRLSEHWGKVIRENCVERADRVKDAVVDSMKFLCEAVALTRGVNVEPKLIEAVTTKKRGKSDG